MVVIREKRGVFLMKKYLLFALMLIPTLSLIACNQPEPQQVSRSEILPSGSFAGEAPNRRTHRSVESLFEFTLWTVYGLRESIHWRPPFYESAYVVRTEILGEAYRYENELYGSDRAIFLNELYGINIVYRAKILDVFYGDVSAGDIIEISRGAMEIDPFTTGDDLVLFLLVPTWTEGGHKILYNPRQSIYRVPQTLAYPQSIISSLLTRSISEDIVFEPTNPNNELFLTTGDLARIAGISDSPWPEIEDPTPPTMLPQFYEVIFHLGGEPESPVIPSALREYRASSGSVPYGNLEYPISVGMGLHPIRPGYNFMGWYLDPNFTERLTIETTMPARDLDLYAKWERIPTLHPILIPHSEGFIEVEIRNE